MTDHDPLMNPDISTLTKDTENLILDDDKPPLFPEEEEKTSNEEEGTSTKKKVRKKRVVKRIVRKKVVRKKKVVDSTPTRQANPFKSALQVDEAPSLLTKESESKNTNIPEDIENDLFGTVSSRDTLEEGDLFGDDAEDSLFGIDPSNSTVTSSSSKPIEKEYSNLFGGIGDEGNSKEDDEEDIPSPVDDLFIPVATPEEVDTEVFKNSQNIKLEPAKDDAAAIGHVDVTVVEKLTRKKTVEAPKSDTQINRMFKPTAPKSSSALDDDLFSLLDGSGGGNIGDTGDFDIASYINQEQDREEKGLFDF